MRSSLVLLSAITLLLASCGGLAAGSQCGAFVPGDTCTPNDKDVTILTNSTQEQCIRACEQKDLNGCCWWSPKDFACEFAIGVHAFPYGVPAVRSASNCTGGVPPPPLPRPAHEQKHVAYGEDDGSVVIAWASLAWPPASTAMLHYAAANGAGGAGVAVAANTSRGGNTSPDVAIHVVTLRGLRAGTKYSYWVAWQDAPTLPSTPTTFSTKHTSLDYAPRLAVFGDLGWTNDQILPYLRDESVAGTVDAILLYGDMTYWWDTASPGTPGHGDHFFRDVAAMSADGAIPFHVSPGNGDSGGNFSEYRARWFMPGWDTPQSEADSDPVQSMWHSFDIGRAHIVGISSEGMGYYAHDEGGRFERMLRWLTADLERANSNSQRSDRPWIIVHLHRPPYSSDGSESQGAQAHSYGVLEALLNEYGVDLVLAGHVHNMERTFPLRNNTRVPPDDPSKPYHNAKAPVYVVSGAVGCAEEHDGMSADFAPWSAWRSMAYGYSHMLVRNSTHLEFDFQSDNLGGALVDKFLVTKDTPCGFGSKCGGAGDGAKVGAARAHARARPSDADGGDGTRFAEKTSMQMQALAYDRDHRIEMLRRCWLEGSQTRRAGHGTADSGVSHCAEVALALPAASGGGDVDGVGVDDARKAHRRGGVQAPARSAAAPRQIIPAAQRELLVALYHACGGATWLWNTNWLSDGDPCDSIAPWHGVGCAAITDATLPDIGTGAPFGVTAVQLSANNLTGTIPASLAAVFGPTLQLLDLADNFLTGTIPPALFSMVRLHTIMLFGRGKSSVPANPPLLHGSLPDPPCTANLKYLHAQRQNLTGSIPGSIGNVCTGLNQVNMGTNALTGVVPASMTKLPLHTIYMAGNNFSCPFPCFHQYSPYAKFDCASCPRARAGCYPCD